MKNGLIECLNEIREEQVIFEMDSMIEYKVRHIKDFSGKILDLNVRKGQIA
ncbi:hypothetical protein [Clostridium ljungdahlii]|uniref:hypothetical protein n=1 Tax=Clostridium ljungdahlii TaxID=1538 RepID=UPI000AB41C1A|nr:hypothetical protein [Clostridium ljungdahlii]